jgi:hypothetical protein
MVNSYDGTLTIEYPTGSGKLYGASASSTGKSPKRVISVFETG